MTWRLSAGVRSISTSEASQRLHAGDLTFRSLNKNRYYSKNKRSFSTSFSDTPLNPYFVSGFSDGESSFHISFLKNNKYKTGFQILPKFTIQLHIKDISLLKNIQSFFGVGTITIKHINNIPAFAVYSVQSLYDIVTKIIPHFDKYLLLSKKRADYILFKEIIYLIIKKDHFTKEGLLKIINIKAFMNKGISEELKKEFTNIIPVERPIVDISNISKLN